MKTFTLLNCVILSTALLGVAQAPGAQARPVTIADTTLLGFQGPHPLNNTTIWNNEVIFESNAGPSSAISLASFDLLRDVKGHSITNGQPFVSVYLLSNKTTLVVMAGRKGSAEPVNWLKNVIFKDYANNPLEGAAAKPDLLNFAVVVDLHLDVRNAPLSHGGSFSGTLTCKNVVLAQGHTKSRDDWWMFGNFDSTDSNHGINHFASTAQIPVRCENDGGRSFNTYWAAIPARYVEVNRFQMKGMDVVSLQ